MFSNKTKTAFIIVLAALAAVSCKDDDETTTYSYLDGSLYITGLEPFITQGSGAVTLTALGASHPDGGEITYTWSVSPSDDESSASSSNQYAFDFDSSVGIGTYTFTCSASASGYYGLSASATAVVVNSGTGTGSSISGVSTSGLSSITDTRTDASGNSGKRYYYTRIGSLDWFVQNLAYDSPSSGDGVSCLPYANSEAMTDLYGLYYSYEAASSACPEGWRLPTLAEWEECIEQEGITGGDLMVNAYFNGSRMWEYWPNVTVTNSLGLNVLPTGYANLATGAFENAFDVRYSNNTVVTMAMFWVDGSSSSDASGANIYKYIIEDQPSDDSHSGIYTGTAADSSFGASVRCVR